MRRFTSYNQQALRFLFALLFCLQLARASAETSYNISLTNPEQHLVEIQIILPSGQAQRELQLPVWNALYQIRDFAQYVNWVRAQDAAGHALKVSEVTNSLWRISGAEKGATVQYEIYVDSFGPFGAQLNANHAFLNLAQILMYPVDARSAPVTVEFRNVPEGWHIAIPLRSSADDQF